MASFHDAWILWRWMRELGAAPAQLVSALDHLQMPRYSLQLVMGETRLSSAGINSDESFASSLALQARLWREMSFSGYQELGAHAGYSQDAHQTHQLLASTRVALAQMIDGAELGSARAGSLSLSWPDDLDHLNAQRSARDALDALSAEMRTRWLAERELDRSQERERERKLRITPTSDVLQLASERACSLSWDYDGRMREHSWRYICEGSAQRARSVAARMLDALRSWRVAHGSCGCGAESICSWNKRESERETLARARSCTGSPPQQPSSSTVTATLVHSGMLDYWGGDGRRWDDDAGCVFARYSRETALRELLDELADDFDNGGDCDSFPESIDRDDVHDALCAMLSPDGWLAYWRDEPCEYAREYASCNPLDDEDEDDDGELPSVVVLLELQDDAYPMLSAADTHHGVLYDNDAHARELQPSATPARELQRSATRAQLASAAQSAIAIKLSERWPTCTSFHQCPYCHDGIDPCAPGDQLTMCESCDTLHHHDCYQHHGCTVLGCDGRAEREASAAPTAAPTADADENWADGESPYGSPSYHSHPGSNAERDMWYAPSALEETYDDYVGRCNREAFLAEHGHLPCVVRHRSGVAIYLGCACNEMEALAESINALQNYPVYDDDAESDARSESESAAWEDWAHDDFVRELEAKFPGLSLDDAQGVEEFFYAACEREGVYWEMEGEGAYIRLEELVWGSNGRLGHPLQTDDDGISLDDIMHGIDAGYGRSELAQLSEYTYEHPSAAERQERADALWRERVARWTSCYRKLDILSYGRSEATDGESASWAQEYGSWQERDALRLAGELTRYRWRGFRRLRYGPALPGEHAGAAPIYPAPITITIGMLAQHVRELRSEAS